MNGPMQFTNDEKQRPHGETITRDGNVLVWDAIKMGWNIFDSARRYVGCEYPDHVRMRADPDSAPILALVRRVTSPKGKYLRLV